MSRKLIATRINESGAVTIKVYRDSNWGEYVVRTINLETGKAHEPCDYFTTEKLTAFEHADYLNQWDWKPHTSGTMVRTTIRPVR